MRSGRMREGVDDWDKAGSFYALASPRRSIGSLGASMLKTARFPILHIIEIVLWLPLLASFVSVVSFIASQPIASLNLEGKSLPSSWEAAVPNHGRFLPGYVVANHPIMFTCSLLGLAGSAAMLYVVHRAQMTQQAEASPELKRAHKIGQICVVAAVAAMSYILVMRVLVGVSPV
jgi:hypothetical protein